MSHDSVLIDHSLLKGEILQLIKLEQNEAAVSMNLVRFANWPDALYCLVGVAKDLHLNPRSVQIVYKVTGYKVAL